MCVCLCVCDPLPIQTFIAGGGGGYSSILAYGEMLPNRVWFLAILLCNGLCKIKLHSLLNRVLIFTGTLELTRNWVFIYKISLWNRVRLRLRVLWAQGRIPTLNWKENPSRPTRPYCHLLVHASLSNPNGDQCKR